MNRQECIFFSRERDMNCTRTICSYKNNDIDEVHCNDCELKFSHEEAAFAMMNRNKKNNVVNITMNVDVVSNEVDPSELVRMIKESLDTEMTKFVGARIVKE